MHTHPTQAQIDDWQANRPRKSMAVKALITTQTGKILLLQPHHKDDMQLPGGAVEANESPMGALIRELQEEVGIVASPTDLQLTDAVWRADYDVTILMYTYAQPLDESKPLVCQAEEIASYMFVPAEQAATRLGGYYKPFWDKFLQK